MKKLTKQPYRQPDGQAIVEGAAMLTVLMPVMVGMTLLTLFVGIYSYYHIAILQVADAGARVAVNDMYWLGMKRPSYQESVTKQKIEDTITNLWSKTGLPGTVSATVETADPSAIAVTVTADKVPIPSGGFLPGLLSLSATAVEPYNVNAPEGIVGLSVTYNTTDTMGIYIPAFGPGACNGAQLTGGVIPQWTAPPNKPSAPYEWHVDCAAPNSETTQITYPIQQKVDNYSVIGSDYY